MLKNRKGNRSRTINYSAGGKFFVTSNVYENRCCLGIVRDGVMFRNVYGDIVAEQWLWLAARYKYVRLHEWVVMPNHFHGIIEIDGGFLDENANLDCGGVGTGRDLSLLGDSNSHLGDFNSLSGNSINPGNQNQIKIKSLSELMGAFKTTASKRIRLAGDPVFKWQRSFYDVLILDAESFCRISDYIEANPKKWNSFK